MNRKDEGRFNETERAPGFYWWELFRSGDGILSLDRNPIWMTPFLALASVSWQVVD